LIAGATAVYGQAEIARSYGQILPVPAERVVVAEDGHRVSLAGRALECIDTPGHARHHHCIWDEASRSWFTGDTFGLSYRELDSAAGAFIVPTSSPVQFEPEAMHASIERLMERRPEAMYLTHYGRVVDTARLAAELHEQIDAMVVIARRCDGLPQRHTVLVEALAGLYVARLRHLGSSLDENEVRRVLGMDIELNAQGLACWLDRDKR
jgi:glyoxylase-like metal-dependent hydrolase (beta-lactamase superfamily II)